ncbi:hypothetical protein BJY04DRAFT_229086 [Aspergillus karnatakaensis]|uniref:uncharacterized protein n=1 Tax=Aspergillus karnatakaensis TaxID=1810916 RepID=UPI003CCD9026
MDPNTLRCCTTKPRIIVTSDISNEPDDAQSLVRYLLYSNEFDTLGLVACTSNSLKDRVYPEDMETIIRAFGTVVNNLNAHVHPNNQYPTADHLLSLVKTGPPVFGRQALQPDVPISSGAMTIINSLESSTESLWVLCWGGFNVIAQALYHLQKAKPAAEFAQLRSRLRVYAISDQDDTGVWIRINFPDIFYICSLYGWNQLILGAWNGMSGELNAPFLDAGGPDTSLVDRSWVKKHIQSIGPLGAVYPDYTFAVEGDTPSFLHLIQNGLGSPDYPEWGGWGGRYILVDLSGQTNHYADTVDRVIGKNGEAFISPRATIWRWREAYQNDFAARMQWTLSPDRAAANHAPVAVVNGSLPGPEMVHLEVEPGSEILLDASASYDPDGGRLSFHWQQYKEPTKAHAEIHWLTVGEVKVTAENDDGSIVKVAIPEPHICAMHPLTGEAVERGQLLHLVLEVRDDGVPAMLSYKRILLQVVNGRLKGGTGKSFMTWGEAYASYLG